MNVCVVSNLFPPDIGGPATYVPKLAADLSRRGHAVSLIVGAPPDVRGQGDQTSYPFRVLRISRGFRLPVRLARFFFSVWRAARRADVVYVNGLAGPELAALLAARLSGTPAALKVVGDFAWEYALRRGWTEDGIDAFQARRYRPWVEAVRAMIRLWARLASRIVVPSHYLKRIVTGWGVPLDKVAVIQNALSLDASDSFDRVEARRALGLGGPVLLTVARLYPWKNLDFLIGLLPQLPGDLRLVIVGDGPERPRLEALAAGLDVADRVLLAGSVSQEMVQWYLRAADVFVLHTRYEGLSHAILEAMAAGTPVVASRVGGNVELIEHERTGLLVPLNDAHSLAGAVCRLLDHREEGARLAAAAREEVRRYSWPLLVETTERLLIELAEARPRG